MDTPGLVFGAIGVAGTVFGGIGVYVRLTIKSFITDTLDGKYPTKELMDAKFQGVHDAISSLPCKQGSCHSFEMEQLKQTVAMMVANFKTK